MSNQSTVIENIEALTAAGGKFKAEIYREPFAYGLGYATAKLGKRARLRITRAYTDGPNPEIAVFVVVSVPYSRPVTRRGEATYENETLSANCVESEAELLKSSKGLTQELTTKLELAVDALADRVARERERDVNAFALRT